MGSQPTGPAAFRLALAGLPSRAPGSVPLAFGPWFCDLLALPVDAGTAESSPLRGVSAWLAACSPVQGLPPRCRPCEVPSVRREAAGVLQQSPLRFPFQLGLGRRSG